MATILHVLMLSLHVTASFERAIAAPADSANLAIHALCGPGLSQALPEDGSQLPSKSGNGSTSCPICTGAAPVACLDAPDLAIAQVVFQVFAATLPSAEPVSVELRQQFAGSIRGPPTLV